MSPVAVPAALAELGIDEVVPFSVGLRLRFRGVTRREGLLLHGPAGWGEWSPFPEYPDAVAARWLDAAIEAATLEPPPVHRQHVPINAIVPAVAPDEAARLVRDAGCATVKVKVADPAETLDDDLARLAAVRSALGPEGQVRLDANAAWDLERACAVLPHLAEAAGGLEYVEQPCRALEALREVRRRTGIAVAVDEGLRLAPDPFAVDLAGAADVLVLKVQPLGGVRRALRVAEAHGLPVVVSSALETSVGLAAGVALAAALPDPILACGLGTATLLDQDAVARPLVAVDGALSVAAAREAASARTAEDTVARRAITTDGTEHVLRRLDAALALRATVLGHDPDEEPDAGADRGSSAGSGR